MPQEFYYPISSATHDLPASTDDGANVGGANKNASTRPGGGRSGPMTHDDATSYVSVSANGFPNTDQSYNVDWPGPIGTYDGVLTLGFRYAALSVSGGGSNNTLALRFMNAAGTAGTARFSISLGPGTSGWATSGPSDVSDAATYRPGGGSWSQADFVNDQTIFINTSESDGGGGGNLTSSDVTSVWGEIRYTPPVGGFAFLLNLAGLGALPFVGAMDFGQFMRYLAWRERFHPRRTKWADRAEILRAWRDVREYKHPRFFQMGVA